jgi:hypothetical protein
MTHRLERAIFGLKCEKGEGQGVATAYGLVLVYRSELIMLGCRVVEMECTENLLSHMGIVA